MRAVVKGGALWVSLAALVLPQAAHAGAVYAFGDSLLDDGTIARTTGSLADAATGPLFSGTNFSNGATAFDSFGGLTGLTVDQANNHAVAKVFSGLNASSETPYPGTLAQVDAFVSSGARFGPRDVVLIDGGTNEVGTTVDPATGVPNGLTAPVTASQLVTYVGANFTAILPALRGAGLRDVVLYNIPSTLPAALAVNAELISVASAASGHGLNVHYFDLLGLYQKVIAERARYGFGTGLSCAASAACVADPANLENSAFTVDGLHPTTAGHDLIARYLASQYLAPQAVLPETRYAEAAAVMFSQTLIARLDSMVQSTGPRGPGVPGSLARFMPDAFVPTALGPLTQFVSGSVAGGTVAAPRTTSGPSLASAAYDLAGLTIGSEVQPTTALRLGSAFSYVHTNASASAFAANRIGLDTVQGSLYGALNGRNAFVDEAVTVGLDVYRTSREGMVSRLRGAPVGGAVSTETKAGYLVDWGAVRIGPVADLAYTHVVIGGYREAGDPLLNLAVGRQERDVLTGAAGVQVRSGPVIAPWITAVLDLTADRDLVGDRQVLVTAEADAPTVLIRTVASDPAPRSYGRVQGTLHADLALSFAGDVSGFTTFARPSGDAYGVDARLSYRF